MYKVRSWPVRPLEMMGTSWEHDGNTSIFIIFLSFFHQFLGVPCRVSHSPDGVTIEKPHAADVENQVDQPADG